VDAVGKVSAKTAVGDGRIVDGGEGATAVEEAVASDAVPVMADDLAGVVYARRIGALGARRLRRHAAGQGIVDGDVAAAAVEEAVVRVRIANDLAQLVDADGLGVEVGRSDGGELVAGRGARLHQRRARRGGVDGRRGVGVGAGDGYGDCLGCGGAERVGDVN